ncbi:hypothetical protein ABZV24_43360 [Streptomyces sp. NPDC005251]|uniref:hypothetical protein n=1 Tax=Streptomyces sp. NPDC005251 TaxID=3157166 RepID=UPI0033BE49D6
MRSKTLSRDAAKHLKRFSPCCFLWCGGGWIVLMGGWIGYARGTLTSFRLYFYERFTCSIEGSVILVLL